MTDTTYYRSITDLDVRAEQTKLSLIFLNTCISSANGNVCSNIIYSFEVVDVYEQ